MLITGIRAFITTIVSIVLTYFCTTFAYAENEPGCGALPDTEFTRLHDVKTDNLCKTYTGKVLLVVNTASQCGFTPQLEGLESLYQQYKDRGFAVLGFPSNDFFQEFKDEKETASFCKENYGVSFPMYSTSAVRGSDANIFYQRLIKQSDTSPKWNFYKYLVDRKGNVVDVYSSRTTPDDGELLQQLELLLKQPQT